MPGTPNHVPTPVIDTVNPAVTQEEDCPTIKTRFNIETGTHDENRKGETKKNSREYQSHHILQDAATNSLIERGAAIAVLLFNSHGGTEHGETTKQQNQRKNNKGGSGTQVASNFGELKKLSRDDLVQSLEGRRTDKDGNLMTKEEAEKLADCLVEEAEEAVREEMEDEDEILTDETPVLPVGGCFAAGTMVWLDRTRQISVENLQLGQKIETKYRTMTIVRKDQCINDLVEINMGEWNVAIAPFHRVRLARGGFVRADELRQGYIVDTQEGPSPVIAVRRCRWQTVYSFGFGRNSICRIGRYGLWVELPDTGVPVSHYEKISPFPSLDSASSGSTPRSATVGSDISHPKGATQCPC